MKVKIVVEEGPDRGQEFVFDRRDRFVIGRSPDAHFCLAQDGYFSRHHLMLEINPPEVLLIDLGSLNGTYVNDDPARVSQTPLRQGDRIRGGGTVLRVEVLLDPIPATLPAAQIPPTLIPPTQLPPTVIPPTQLAGVLDQLLPARPEAKVTKVRCLRCGQPSPDGATRAVGSTVAYFCDECQAALLDDPMVIPGYQVLRELGRGGMGAVYLAQHTILGVKRALKVILPKAASSEQVRAHFLREAASQAALDHPRIVRLFELQEVKPGLFCMAMEYVEGESAERLLVTAGGRLPIDLALEIVDQTLEGLEYAHSRGIVHRDVKDANVIVSRDESGRVAVKLLDFGLAKSYETSGLSGFTCTGTMAGTPFYMPPEQILDYRNVRPPADLYAAGVMLYHLLTGAFPLDFRPNANVFLVVLEGPITPLAARRPEIPPRLAAAVERALSKQVAERYQSAQEMRHALRVARA